MKHTLFLITLFLAFNAYSQSVPNYVDTAGLKGWWSFTGNANDSSGNGFNGIVTGATLTSDKFGNLNSAYRFNGVSDYITTTASFAIGNGAKSYSAWFKLDTVKRGWIIAGGLDMYGQAFGLFMQDYNGTVSFHGMDATDVIIDTITDTSVWHNIVVTYESDTLKAYVDDTLRISVVEALSTMSSNIIFGRRQNAALESNNEAYFQGKIDDIGIWDRALSQCEVNKLYYSMDNLIKTGPVNDTVLTGGIATYTITDTGGSATYQWQENNGTGFSNLSNVGVYSGVTTKTLTISSVTATMNNYKYRCLRNAGTCVDTSNSAKLIVNEAAGINTYEMSNSIRIAPNPVNDILTINSVIAIDKVEILNLLGQVVATNKQNTIDVSGLNKGVYVLKVNGSIIKKFQKD